MNKTNKIMVAAAFAASAVLTAANAATPITNTINNVEWRFQIDESTKTAMLGLITATTESSTTDPDDGTRAVSKDVDVNAADIPWKFTYNDEEYTVTSVAMKAFYKNSKLTGILTIPSSVTDIRRNAFRQSGLTYLKGGESVETWGFLSFYKCTNMEGPYPEFTMAREFGQSPFKDTKLTGTIKLGSKLTSLPQLVFDGYAVTGALVIPANVTQVSSNISGNNAYGPFNQCTNLVSIWIKGGATTTSVTKVYCTALAKQCTNLKLFLAGPNTMCKQHNTNNGFQTFRLCPNVQAFVPASGWSGLADNSGPNNEDNKNGNIWYYGPTNDFNLAIDDTNMKITITPTTAETFTNALSWATLFEDQLDLKPYISVTNAIDLTGITITEEMCADVTFDRLMFKATTQTQLNAILAAIPATVSLGIDPEGATEDLYIDTANGRNVWVKLPANGEYKVKKDGLIIMFR